MGKRRQLADCEIRTIIGYLENERKRIWLEVPPWEDTPDELDEIVQIIEKLRAMVN